MNKLIKKKIIKKELIKIFDFIKNNSKLKFIESIDISINLKFYNNKDFSKNIFGTVLLPNNIFYKKRKIIVFTSKNNYKLAINSGAYIVGKNKLFNLVKKKKIDYDIVICTTNVLDLVKKLEYILNPKGLMPKIELGTVTNNLDKTINNFINGQILYRSDKFGIIHTTFGKINFDNIKLYENFLSLIESIKFNKINNNFIFKKITISSTMGKSYLINLNNILN